jgi:HTH-type transcriptional regulator/antitoxin HigA
MATKISRRPRPSASNKRTSKRVPDTYLDLVRKFPLIHVRDDDHLAEATEVLDRLLERDLDEGEQAYVDVLTDLIEDYEDEHIAIPDASEADVLRELMRANRITQAELKRRTGIAQSTISAVLSGVRSLTKDQIVLLAKFFHVSPAVFMPASR